MIDMGNKFSDGYSCGILIRELIRELFKIYYNEPLNGLPLQYSDYPINYDEEI
ncbi:hypothetical protein H8356DRAFT_1654967 [Neocallimastix lanati (nom. inval.)]|nr:hypothetical protein H8356DRAFT_1654967 [Neocallimastix sp. JGI-2020a]